MDKKKQALDNLYALRAGLSVISQQYDKAQSIENECDRKLKTNTENFCGELFCTDNYPVLNKLKEKYGFKDLSQNEIEEMETKYANPYLKEAMHNRLIQKNASVSDRVFGSWLAEDESTRYFQRNLTNAQNNKDEVDKGKDSSTFDFSYKKEYKREKRLSILFFILATIFAAGAIVIASGVLGPWDTGVLIGVFIVPLIVFLVLGIVYIFKAKHDKLQHSGKVNTADTQVKAAQLILENLPQVRENARKILKERDTMIAPIKESSNDFYMALKKQFNSLLDERDWKNLDLVIFELETRRADNIKEALQLVDRELQAERIEQTIVQATEQICYELRRGFAEIKETIFECSRVISTQLATISLQLGEMNEQLSKLCDGVNMSNALQAKANVTSAKLLSDVHAIRYYQ